MAAELGRAWATISLVPLAGTAGTPVTIPVIAIAAVTTIPTPRASGRLLGRGTPVDSATGMAGEIGMTWSAVALVPVDGVPVPAVTIPVAAIPPDPPLAVVTVPAIPIPRAAVTIIAAAMTAHAVLTDRAGRAPVDPPTRVPRVARPVVAVRRAAARNLVAVPVPVPRAAAAPVVRAAMMLREAMPG